MRTWRFEKGQRGEPRPDGPHNICGVAVHALPGRARDLEDSLTALPGVEVHAVTANGRLVVTIEDTRATLAAAILNDLPGLPGVASVALVYHNFEQPEASAAPIADHALAGGISR
jgi:nitrate reductase NapD